MPLYACVETLQVTEAHTSRALALLLQRTGFSPRDAVHAATNESAGFKRILSTGTHFDAVRQVQRIPPDELLGGNGT